MSERMVTMNEFDGLVRELIYELLRLDLDELAELRKEWNGMPIW